MAAPAGGFRIESEAAIADDAAAIAGGIAGVAQVDHFRVQAVMAGCQQQAVDGVAPQASSCEMSGSPARMRGRGRVDLAGSRVGR